MCISLSDSLCWYVVEVELGECSKTSHQNAMACESDDDDGKRLRSWERG